MPRTKKEKVVHKPFFDEKFFRFMGILSSKNPEERELVQKTIDSSYAIAVRLLCSLKRLDIKKQVEAGVQAILEARNKRAFLLRIFFEKFLDKKIQIGLRVFS